MTKEAITLYPAFLDAIEEAMARDKDLHPEDAYSLITDGLWEMFKNCDLPRLVKPFEEDERLMHLEYERAVS